MLLRFRDATVGDVPLIAALLNSTAGALTARHGAGHWSQLTSERAVEHGLRHARVRVGIGERRVVTTLRLATKKPWAIDVAYFTQVRRPLYLTSMAVSVSGQGHGYGRQALADAAEVARRWPADAVRLDAYDAPAGAGAFYEACGFHHCGSVEYKGNPLRYYELVL